jgi:hypothetical protein
MDEYELRKRVQEGQEARQTFERVSEMLDSLESEWIRKLKLCPSDGHDDRLMIQCQLNAIDGLRSEFAYRIDGAKIAEQELTLIEKAQKKVQSLFG